MKPRKGTGHVACLFGKDMPSLAEQLAATKLKADQVLARQHKLEVLLNKHNHLQIGRLYSLLGEGAIAGDLMNQCLQHVSEAKRTRAQAIYKEQADNLKGAVPEFTDKPQDQKRA